MTSNATLYVPPPSDSSQATSTLPSGHVFIAQSLDGFIARPDDNLDWLVGFSKLGEDHGYDAFISTMDGIIMGRKTFEAVREATWTYPKPVWVLSQVEPSEQWEDKVTIVKGTPKEVMELAGKQGWKKVYVDGGMVIQSFLKEGLIGHMVISTVPILIGQGVRLFGERRDEDGSDDVLLKLVETRSFSSGLVQTHYRVLKEGG